MVMWKRGEYQGLVEDTIQTMESSFYKARGATTSERRAKVFDAKVKMGHFRAAVRYIYETSTIVSSHLIQAVQGGITFRPTNHMLT